MRRIIMAVLLALASQAARAEILVGGDAPACRAAAAFSDPRRGAAILVLQDGRPICEAYSGAGAADRRMEIWSGTKSFSGVMAAAAVQDGLLTLDEPVSRTIPEWAADPRKAKATIRHLLTLSVGLRTEVGRPPEYADAAARPLEAEPGQKFIYGPGPYQVWGEVMKRKLAAAGQPADPYLYLKRRILDPIGMSDIVWRRTPGGDPLMPQGAVMTAREWARFGEFVRAGGKAGGRSLVDPATFRQLFRSSAANPGYGITWWLPHAQAAGGEGPSSDFGRNAARLPADLVVAAGAGDQRLYVIPSRRMTIVRLASFSLRDAVAERRGGAAAWSDTEFLETLLGSPGR